jgi:hypothetical protein
MVACVESRWQSACVRVCLFLLQDMNHQKETVLGINRSWKQKFLGFGLRRFCVPLLTLLAPPNYHSVTMPALGASERVDPSILMTWLDGD